MFYPSNSQSPNHIRNDHIFHSNKNKLSKIYSQKDLQSIDIFKMTFDNHSLERLKELGRKLPDKISKSQQIESKTLKETKKRNLHPVEIETNPEKLFRELIEASPDGNVPPHLLERLKKLESDNVKISTNIEPVINEDSPEISSKETLKLYTQFQQFLLEDDTN